MGATVGVEVPEGLQKNVADNVIRVPWVAGFTVYIPVYVIVTVLIKLKEFVGQLVNLLLYIIYV